MVGRMPSCKGKLNRDLAAITCHRAPLPALRRSLRPSRLTVAGRGGWPSQGRLVGSVSMQRETMRKGTHLHEVPRPTVEWPSWEAGLYAAYDGAKS